jgi:hypothetical protein
VDGGFKFLLQQLLILLVFQDENTKKDLIF